MATEAPIGASGPQTLPDALWELASEFRAALGYYVIAEPTSEYKRLLESTRRTERITRFMDLLQNEQASDPRLVAPLVWLNKIAATWGYGQPHMSALADRARMLLVRHHIQEEAIGLALAGFMCFDSASQAAEALFREALESNPHRDVQGRACYWLARFLHEQAESIPLPRATPSEFNLEREMEKRWGKEAVEALKAKEPSKLLAEAEKLLIRARLEYPDVGEFGQAKDDTPLEETAARYLHEVRHLMPGCSAPDIAGLDSDGMPLRLSDYRGNLILLENLEPQST